MMMDKIDVDSDPHDDSVLFCGIQKSERNELINDIRNKFNWDPY